MVALLAEGVDRNTPARSSMASTAASPSSRRAWIEMCFPPACALESPVALLAEGVDRNDWVDGVNFNGSTSPSSRRVWIEIGRTIQVTDPPGRRPPRGGRG